MTVGVGLRIGGVVSTAVVATNDPGSPDPVVIVRDTVLHMFPDGTALFGGRAPRRRRCALGVGLRTARRRRGGSARR